MKYILVFVILAYGGYGCRKDVEGCMDLKATNFNPHATKNDGSCNYDVMGCTNLQADNYDPRANIDDGSCIIVGCMDSTAFNYNPSANQSNGSCDNDWGPGFSGSWAGLNCSIDFQNSLLLTITYDPNVPNTIVFEPMFLDFSTRYATFNGKNITFPSQSFGLLGFGSMTGTGVLSTSPDTTLACTFIYNDGLIINGTCTVIYTKQ